MLSKLLQFLNNYCIIVLLGLMNRVAFWRVIILLFGKAYADVSEMPCAAGLRTRPPMLFPGWQ